MLATPPPVVFSPPLDERNSEHLSSSLPPFPSPARVSSTEPEKKTPPKRKPVSEIISQALPPFDHQSSVVEPFGRLAEQDAEFQKQLGEMLTRALIKFNAWSTARIKYESETAEAEFSQKLTSLMEIEREQEKTRQRLLEFIARMKAALAALTM